jgi:hypothetical protein
MTEEKSPELVDRLDDLLEEYGMPEVVAALVHLSRSYAEALRDESNRESLGWEPWERGLSGAFREAAGEDLEALIEELRGDG